MGGAEFSSHAPTLVTAPLFVAAMLFMSVVVGRRLLNVFGPAPVATPAEHVVVSVALGFGLLQFLPFVLGTLGILGPNAVRITFAVLGAVALLDAPTVVRAALRWWSGRRRLGIWERVWVLLVALPLLFEFFRALAPAYDPDGLGYHLTAPKRWLEIGSLNFLPTLTFTNAPMGTEMLYAIALPLVGDGGAKLLHFGAGLLAAIGVYLLGTRVGGALAGRVACVLFLLGPVGVHSVLGSAYAEGTASLAVVASTLCWVLWFQSNDQAWLRIAALLAGFAVSFKLTSVLLPLALSVLTVLVVRARGAQASGLGHARVRTVSLFAALVALPVVPWLTRALVVTGNPVFPVFAQWIPSHDFPPEMARMFETYNRYLLWGSRWGNDLSIDKRRAILGVAALLVLAIATVVFVRLRDRVHRAVVVVIAMTAVVQLLTAGLYTRYWVPLAAVMQIPVIVLVVARLKHRQLLAGLFAITLVLVAIELRSDLKGHPADLVAASMSDDRREEFLLDKIPLLPLVREANDDSASDSAVLMTDICAGFYIDGPLMCTGFNGSLRVSDWEAFSHDVTALHITDVITPTIVAEGGVRSHGNGAGAVSFLLGEQTDAMISRLLQERGELRSSVNGWSHYRLTPATASGANSSP